MNCLRYLIVVIILVLCNFNSCFSNGRAGIFFDISTYTLSTNHEFSSFAYTCASCEQLNNDKGRALNYNPGLYYHLEDLLFSISYSYEFKEISLFSESNLFVIINQKPTNASILNKFDFVNHSNQINLAISKFINENFNFELAYTYSSIYKNQYAQYEKLIEPKNEGFFPETGNRIRNSYTGTINSEEIKGQSILSIKTRYFFKIANNDNSKANIFLISKIPINSQFESLNFKSIYYGIGIGYYLNLLNLKFN